MSLRFDVVEEDGLVLARVPCDIAWILIERLADRRVQATYSIRGQQLVIYFRDMNRASAQQLMDLSLEDAPQTSTADNTPAHGDWARQLLIGQHI